MGMKDADVFKNLLVKIAKAESESELNSIVYDENVIGWSCAYDSITEEEMEILYGLVNSHKACRTEVPVML